MSGGEAHVENSVWMRAVLIGGVFLTIGILAFGAMGVGVANVKHADWDEKKLNYERVTEQYTEATADYTHANETYNQANETYNQANEAYNRPMQTTPRLQTTAIRPANNLRPSERTRKRRNKSKINSPMPKSHLERTRRRRNRSNSNSPTRSTTRKWTRSTPIFPI